jgi:NitT/TauT family transport system substrate-binding protein
MNEHRRALVQALAAAGAIGWGGGIARAASAEPPPETTRIRLPKVPTACLAPQYVAEELLRAEGFNQIEYVGQTGGVSGAQKMGAGEVDIGMNFAAPLVVAVDMGVPVVMLSGVHAGCFELFANKGVASIKDLKGKTVSTLARGSAQHIFLASIATSVGIDPNRDIRWLDNPPAESKRLLAEGGIDAFLAFPPDAQELRAKKVARLLLNSAVDRPWAQYFCCMIVANRDWATRHPVAARRATRATLKGSELCAADPELGAKAFLAQGYDVDRDFARQAVRELPFGKWRDYNPEETLRFYALRLREAEMIKGSPQKIIASGSDWRIVDQLRKEMKS